MSDFFASLFQRAPLAGEAATTPARGPAKSRPTAISELGECARLLPPRDGGWLMYLTFAVTLNTSVGTHLWL